MALFDFSNSQSILLASILPIYKYSNDSLYYRLYSTQTMFVYILKKKQNGGRRRRRPIPVISVHMIIKYDVVLYTLIMWCL